MRQLTLNLSQCGISVILEQIDTALLIAAQPGADDGWQASALLLQRIPETGGSAETGVSTPDDEDMDLWHTACTLMATCSRDEMLDPGLARRICCSGFFMSLMFAFSRSPLRDECRCSPERVERMLATLSDEEKSSLSDDGERIMISCEFCKKEHVYHLS